MLGDQLFAKGVSLLPSYKDQVDQAVCKRKFPLRNDRKCLRDERVRHQAR